jgi:nucleotide-binding universal stress UspA family protein
MKKDALAPRRLNRTPGRRITGEKRVPGVVKIKNLLVPLDFSAGSHTAIQFALALLDRFADANLHLVHVMPGDSPISGLADMPMVIPDIEMARRIRRDLGSLAENSGVQLRRCNLHVGKGTPFKEICEFAQKIDADLIVISTRGHTGLKHLTLGSTAERVFRYSPCPVLVVRHTAQSNKGDRNGKNPLSRWTIGKILVPTDFSDCSAKSLAYAKGLAKEFGASLILLHSIALQCFVSSDEYARYDLPLLMQQSEKIARQRMRELVSKTDWEGVKVESSLQIGHAGQQVCASAEAEKADLIVTATHGYTGLKHVLIGSTAEYVVRHAECPVLVVPTRERPVFN